MYKELEIEIEIEIGMFYHRDPLRSLIEFLYNR